MEPTMVLTVHTMEHTMRIMLMLEELLIMATTELPIIRSTILFNPARFSIILCTGNLQHFLHKRATYSFGCIVVISLTRSHKYENMSKPIHRSSKYLSKEAFKSQCTMVMMVLLT